jgi:hypothetical protein
MSIILIACVGLLTQILTQEPTRAIASFSIFIASSARLMPAILRIYQSAVTIKGNKGYALKTILEVQSLPKYKHVSH